MRTLLNLFILLIIVAIVVFFPIFFSLALVSMMIVPATWAYALITGQSYNFVIDQSNMLYKLNKFGQWSLLIGGSLFIFFFLFFS